MNTVMNTVKKNEEEHVWKQAPLLQIGLSGSSEALRGRTTSSLSALLLAAAARTSNPDRRVKGNRSVSGWYKTRPDHSQGRMPAI